jgi:hypothetical protein
MIFQFGPNSPESVMATLASEERNGPGILARDDTATSVRLCLATHQRDPHLNPSCRIIVEVGA